MKNKHKCKKIMFSTNIFELDLAYVYSDAIFETDGVVFCDDPISGIFVLEEASGKAVKREGSKIPIRYLFNPLSPTSLWIGNIEELSKKISLYKLVSSYDENELSERLENMNYYFPELITFFLYSFVLLSKGYKKLIIKDILRSLKLSDNKTNWEEDYDSFRTIINILGKELARIEEKVDYRVKVLKDILSRSEVWIILPQFGLGEYSLKAIVDSVKLLYDKLDRGDKFSLNMVYLGINKSLRERYCEEIEEMFRLLKSSLPSNVSVERISIDKERLLDSNEFKDKKIVVLLMQDWSKELLKRFIGKREQDLNILIIPETFYVATRSEEKTSSTKRTLITRGKYLTKLDKLKDEEFWRTLAMKITLLR